MSHDHKPQEFWIVNDNLTNPEHQISKAYHYPPNLLFPVIHVIEFSAYETVVDQRDKLMNEYMDVCENLQAERQRNEKLVEALKDTASWLEFKQYWKTLAEGVQQETRQCELCGKEQGK